ncbi:DnaJ domain-containing protein [Sulfobacillus acidophilus]|uniref:DnaJ domain-containing protein n=1 Tax=Sulfobacillus acidophilus TaxID=53633 RepID=A0ABS3AYN8_9FIRM|nr:DnaJ domain-containing protein [Sulfobacillus acidophilus]
MSVSFQDYYKVLGVTKNATKSEIQKAYRKLAKKYHPDVSGSKASEEKFKKITEAYEVLKNPDSRRQYDTLGSSYKSGDPFSPPPGWQNIDFDFGATRRTGGGFSDFFEMIFGGSGFQGARGFENNFWQNSNIPQNGNDQEVQINVSLHEVANCEKKPISLRIKTTTKTGEIEIKNKTYQIKIPKGTTNGTRIRLYNQGGEGKFGGKNGDLYLKVKIVPELAFEIDGYDLKVKIPISPWEAALGCTAKIKTLTGSVQLKIPKCTQSGTKLRLRGKGLPMKNDNFGNMQAEVKITLPTSLTKKEEELFEALKKVSKFNPRGAN